MDQWYNDSTGEGDNGEIDADGPWKNQKGVTVVESPALQEFQVLKATPKSSETTLFKYWEERIRTRRGRVPTSLSWATA